MRRREGKTDTYTWPMGVTGVQSSSCVFIVQNFLYPDLVAVIPHDYIENIQDTKAAYTTTRTFPISVTGPQPEPFPMEWSPCVMPMGEWLVKTLENLEKFTSGSEDAWTNAYNGFAYGNCQRPPLVHTDLLLPIKTSRLTDYPAVRRIQAAFRDESRRYRIELTTIRPLVGDFVVCCEETGKRSTIELKRSVAHLGRLGTKMTHGAHASGRETSESAVRYFTPLTSWDYLLTTLYSRGDNRDTQALLLARTDIPTDWFYTAETTVSMTHDPDWYTQRTVYMKNPHQLVKDFERILDPGTRQIVGLSSPHIPFKSPTLSDTGGADNVEIWEATSVDEEHAMSAVWEARKRELPIVSLLSRQCESSRVGRVYDLGSNHPSATHVLVPNVDHTSFMHLHPDTPMVLLNFLQIDQLDSRKASDIRRPLGLLRASHGRSPSLYIMFPADVGLLRSSLNLYVVPSKHLISTKRHRQSENWISQSSKRVSREYTTVLGSSALTMDSFACRADRVGAAVCQYVGSDSIDLLVKKRDVTGQYEQVLARKMLWT